MAKEIILQNGMKAIVDDEDYETVKEFTWTLDLSGYGFRVRNGSNAKMRLASLILTIPKGKIVHFKNGNRLDFRKDNLSFLDPYNKSTIPKARKDSQSGYKGVGWCKQSSRWRARIRHKGKRYHIGYFESKEDAAVAYNQEAKKLFGEGAYLNKIGDNNRTDRVIVEQSRKIRRNTSIFRGVYKKQNKWCVSINVNGKSKHIGYYETELEAAKAYNKAAIEAFGDKAIINEIGEEHDSAEIQNKEVSK